MLTSRLRWLGLALFAVLLPYEIKTPIVSLGPIAITNVEGVLYTLIAVWSFSVLRARRIHWSPVHSVVLVLLIVQLGAASFAPFEREAAIKFALRGAGGAAVFFIAAEWVRAGRGSAWVMSALACGAVLSAVFGILEVQSEAAQSALLIFKTQTTLLGGQVRASGTFQYANTAAMYWEAALPITLAVGAWWSITRAQSRWRWFALAASLIVIEAILLSASRAALVSAAIVLTIMLIAGKSSSTRSSVGRLAGFSLITLGVLSSVQLIVNPFFTTRLRAESDDSWYRAVIQPARVEWIAAANDVLTTTVVVTNTSVRTWMAAGARPIHLSYHWLHPDSRRILILDGERTPLPRDLAPGESAAVAAFVKVPLRTGALLLQWDLVQEDVTWFSERGSAVAEVNVQVRPARQHPAVEAFLASGQLSRTSSPSRAELWRAGVQMWLSHPLLGIGPDNFRRAQGRYLGQVSFDDRLTANSWYVELLATTGAVGLLSWLLIPGTLVLIARRQWRTLAQTERILAIGLSAGLLAFFLHGVVDYFMAFTPTYGLFWLSTGLLVGLLTGKRKAELASAAEESSELHEWRTRNSIQDPG